MTVELNLGLAEGLSCIWLKRVYASDHQPTEDTVLAILGWLPRPRIENLLTFASLKQLCSSLHALRCGTSIFSKCGRFQYEPQTINRWFSPPPPPKGKRKHIVKVINVNRQGKEEKCYNTQDDNNFPHSLSNDEYELFFHGTTHESAEDIIENGIDLNLGAEKKDFSDGYGFYVGNDFDNSMSVRWARNRPPCSAVLVFRVRIADLRGRMRGLNLDVDVETWKEIVTHFRCGRRSRRFLRQYENYDFIEGPMAGEGQNFIYPTPNDNTYQLCVKRLDCARLFDESLHSALFFEPPR